MMGKNTISLVIVNLLSGVIFAQPPDFGSLDSPPTFGTLAAVPDFGTLNDTKPGRFDALRPAALPADAQSTPHKEVHRILKWFNLTPESTLVEYGCGYDARFCIAASSVYGCKSIGIEIDSGRAAMARSRVVSLGLSDLVTIIEGDATRQNIEADYGVAYLWPDTLAQLRQKIIELDKFASFSHDVPGMTLTKSGDSFFWNKSYHEQQQESAANTQPVGYWGGQAYVGRVCSNPNCAMCNAIQAEIEQKKEISQKIKLPEAQQINKSENVPEMTPGVNGNYYRIKYCNGKKCWYRTEWRWYQGQPQ